MKKRILILLGAIEHFANIASEAAEALFLPNAFAPAADNWVQLSPFGDFGNIDAKKQRVIQRFRKEDAENVANEFNSLGRKITQPLGMPFYVGHPDHPRFKGEAGHSDTGAKGRGKEFAVRHDAACAKCGDFANSGAPCAEHGLFAKMHWNPEGEQLIANEAFHGHSVNWAAIPAGTEGGVRIMRPVRVKSVGFTNEPGIPVTPAMLANEMGENEATEPAADKALEAAMIVPPKLKVLAGFKADEDVTLEQCIAALEKARSIANEAAPVDITLGGQTVSIRILTEGADVAAGIVALANEAKAAVETAAGLATELANAKAENAQLSTSNAQRSTEFANERAARAGGIVDALVKAGKIITADKAAKTEELANAGEAFDAKAAEFSNGKVLVKVTSKTGDLAGKHAVITHDVRDRGAKFEGLMAAREQEFANETYEARFNAVAGSGEGQALFAQMQRPAGPETKD